MQWKQQVLNDDIRTVCERMASVMQQNGVCEMVEEMRGVGNEKERKGNREKRSVANLHMEKEHFDKKLGEEEKVYEKKDVCGNSKHRPCFILFLSTDIESLPWESLPMFAECTVTRMTSLCAFFGSLRDRVVAGCRKRDDVVGRNRDEAKAVTVRTHLQPSPSPTNPSSSVSKMYLLCFLSVSPCEVSLVDPCDGLRRVEGYQDETGIVTTNSPVHAHTQAQMQAKSSFCTRAIVGRTPSGDEICSMLRASDIYVYFGHGDGGQYYSEKLVGDHARTPVVLRMGCCSGARHVVSVLLCISACVYVLR
jgi:hypothetical protein